MGTLALVNSLAKHGVHAVRKMFTFLRMDSNEWYAVPHGNSVTYKVMQENNSCY